MPTRGFAIMRSQSSSRIMRSRCRTLIENQARNLLNNFAQDMQQRGVDLNQVDQQFIEMAYSKMRTQASAMFAVRCCSIRSPRSRRSRSPTTRSTKRSENGRLLSGDGGGDPRFARETGRRGRNIRNNLKTRKAIEAVIAKAKITDGPMGRRVCSAEASSGGRKSQRRRRKRHREERRRKGLDPFLVVFRRYALDLKKQRETRKRRTETEKIACIFE